jgi:hypothetical protein
MLLQFLYEQILDMFNWRGIRVVVLRDNFSSCPVREKRRESFLVNAFSFSAFLDGVLQYLCCGAE